MNDATPEQIGLTVENITSVVRNPRLFSQVVYGLCGRSGDLDTPKARLCRDALAAGEVVIKVLGITCALDQETVLKNIESCNVVDESRDLVWVG